VPGLVPGAEHSRCHHQVHRPELSDRGRSTLRLRLEPVEPLGGRLLLRKLGPMSCLEAYPACGGDPLHLLAWDEQASTTKNPRRLALTPAATHTTQVCDSLLAPNVPASGRRAYVISETYDREPYPRHYPPVLVSSGP
jgi:hypothetical protein